mmetsp:Transcript_45560/g.93212  ORF Transcript_45560/g.93212 Transcript_45560/m.93212 type:complete len:89 (+) Transcript_45560:422-688(+)
MSDANKLGMVGCRKGELRESVSLNKVCVLGLTGCRKGELGLRESFSQIIVWKVVVSKDRDKLEERGDVIGKWREGKQQERGIFSSCEQ